MRHCTQQHHPVQLSKSAALFGDSDSTKPRPILLLTKKKKKKLQQLLVRSFRSCRRKIILKSSQTADDTEPLPPTHRNLRFLPFKCLWLLLLLISSTFVKYEKHILWRRWRSKKNQDQLASWSFSYFKSLLGRLLLLAFGSCSNLDLWFSYFLSYTTTMWNGWEDRFRACAMNRRNRS